jgi:hypothetical protein
MPDRVDGWPQAAAAKRHGLRTIRCHRAERERGHCGNEQLAHFILL